MSQTTSELAKTFTSFAGSDIRCVIGGEEFASLQAVSYMVQREKGANFVLGHKEARSFARGKRAVAGTMVGLLFDRHLIYSSPFLRQLFLAARDELKPTVDDLNDASNLSDYDQVDPGYVFDASDLTGSYQLSRPWYVDQILPFDIVIVGANEYGQSAEMRIYGTEIMNEGAGFNIDSLQLETQMTFIARGILPWKPLASWDMNTGAVTPITIE